MESRDVKAEQRQETPVTPPKKRRRPKPDEKSTPANGGSSGSAAGSSSLSRTSSSSTPSNDADGKAQQQQHEQGGGGKRPRLVWTTELHDLFVEAYDSLGDEAVPRRILEKMNVPEISREKVASHLQKHKLNLRRLAEEASSQSPTVEAPAAAFHHPLRSLPPNTTPLAAPVSPAAQLVLLQQVLEEPTDCLSRSSSSIAANLQIVQSIQQQQQQQLCGLLIKEGQAQPAAQTMQRAPNGHSGFSRVGMETSTAVLDPEAANTEEAMMRMVQAAKAENAVEPEEAAPAPGSILGQFWPSPDNEAASTSSWDIFALSPRT